MPPCIASKAYGTVSPEQQKQMGGLEFVQGLANGTLPLNTMAETLGYDVSEAESGRIVVTAVPDHRHLNPAGTVHGGLAATMLVHGPRDPYKNRKRFWLDHARVQDFTAAADHSGNRAD
jgi:hypothetical protein